MADLPRTDGALLIRTDFSADAAWQALAEAASAPSPDGFCADLCNVDDPSLEGASAEQLAKLAAEASRHAIVFVADAVTMSDPERPVLCVALDGSGRSFRIVPGEMWGVENNLSLANMDFEEFADSVDDDGIFRGFPL